MKLSTTAYILSSVLSAANLSDHQCIAQTIYAPDVSKRPKADQKASKSPKAGQNSTKKGKKGHYDDSKERVVTMWWVLFNKPSACATNPEGPVKCGVADLMANAMAGKNDPNIAVINASGGISGKDGFLRLAAALYKTDSCALDLEADSGAYLWGGPPPLYDTASIGYCPADGENTEVHIVLRDHGPPTEDKLAQMTRFTDPSCASVGGPNLCVDSGAVGFPSMSEDGLMAKDVGHFPMFPPGCADAGTCEIEVEMVQLVANSGNEVTLIRTGDAFQAIAEITLP